MKKRIDQCTAFFFAVAGWLCCSLVLLTGEQVCSRYLFNASSVAFQELEWHIFGAIFLLATAHTLKRDEHVRVDVIYSKLTEKKKAIIDLVGLTLLIIPSSLIIISYGISFTAQAFSFENIHPLDYYTHFLTERGSAMHAILSPIEKILRTTLLAGEISPDPGGLEARWIIKSAIPFGFFLLILQSMSLIAEKISFLRQQK